MKINDFPTSLLAAEMHPGGRHRLSGLERMLSGTTGEVARQLPQFDRAGFAMEGGIANPFLDVVTRRADERAGLPAMPVGVVSKRYRLISHQEIAGCLSAALSANGIGAQDVRAEARLSAFGARMALFLKLPRRFDFDPGDGHPLALRLLCFNSVDGSSPLRVLLGWYRYVCANGMAVGTTRFECRTLHRDDAVPPDLSSVLKSGIESAQREQAALKRWVNLRVDNTMFVAFADQVLADRWGVKAAARFLHIVTTGFDAEPAQPFEKGLPHMKSMKPTRRVPGSPLAARTAYDACQALTWLARDRQDPREAADWMLQVPELMKALLQR